MKRPCTVKIIKSAEKKLDRLPKHIKEAIYVWLVSVEEEGIRSVRKLPGYHDEPLKGKRKGQRSVRLSRSYRLIYEEITTKEEIVLTVLEVSKHEY